MDSRWGSDRWCGTSTPHRLHRYSWSDEYDSGYWATCQGRSLELIKGDKECWRDEKHSDHYYEVKAKATKEDPLAPITKTPVWYYCPGLEQDRYVWGIDHGIDGEPQLFPSEKAARKAMETCSIHRCKLVRKPNVKVWENVD